VDLIKRFDAEALAPAVAKATEAIASADAVLQDALDALTVSTCSFTQLPHCPIDPATATELAGRHADLTAKIARANDTLNQHEEDSAAMAAEMACPRGQCRRCQR